MRWLRQNDQSHNKQMQQISTKRILAQLGGQGDPLEIVQEIKIRSNKWLVYAQLRICCKKWDAQTPMGFWDTNGSPNLGPMTRPYNTQ